MAKVKALYLRIFQDLIEGAHEGAGIGDRFLGHVERCAALLHLVDGTNQDVALAYRTVRHELAAYGGGLADKLQILALNKIDALSEDDIAEKKAALAEASGGKIYSVSGVSGAGLPELLGALMTLAEAARRQQADHAVEAEMGKSSGWKP